MNFITIDFETATADRDSPCELGLTFVENWKITATKAWLIKPCYYPNFDYFNIQIHGIQPHHVANQPEFDIIWKEVKPLIENQFLIAHNAGFDFSVLRRTLDRYNLEYPTLDYSCSYIFSKKVWEGLPGYDLKTLCRINNIELNHHRAAADSKATAELVIKAFQLADITSMEDFPEKLRTVVGKLFAGGYKPSKTKAISKSAKKNKEIR
jgi:DNA polymerase-3 subunit epsilon